MDNNLVSLNYLIDQLNNLEDFSMSLNGEVLSEISELNSSVFNFLKNLPYLWKIFLNKVGVSMKVWTLI